MLSNRRRVRRLRLVFLAGARVSAWKAREMLKASTEHLPGGVGLLFEARHAVEGEASLELGVCLLVASAAVVEVPQCARLDALVGVDGRVLVVAVIRVEEVELEVLPSLMADLAAVEHEAADPTPDREPSLVVAGAFVDARPVGPGCDLLEVEPGIKGRFDRVLDACGVEYVQHVVAEEGRVHAEFQLAAPAHRGANLADQGPDEADCGLAVVDVAGTVEEC